jgi:hypothetical protein
MIQCVLHNKFDYGCLFFLFPTFFVPCQFLCDFFLLLQRLDLRGHKVRSLNASGLNLTQNLEVNMHYLDALVLIFANLSDRECLTETPVWQFVYLRDNLLHTLEGIEILKRVKVCFMFHHDSISYYNTTWPFSVHTTFELAKFKTCQSSALDMSFCK